MNLEQTVLFPDPRQWIWDRLPSANFEFVLNGKGYIETILAVIAAK